MLATLSSRMRHPRPTSLRAPLAALFSLLLFPFSASSNPPAAPEGMLLIRAGSYQSLYRSPDQPLAIPVAAFLLDEHPVTNADYLAFVTANPNWRRSQTSELFADEAYLRHWASDLDLGPDAAILADLPVVNVSWYAARAYARYHGKRLPSLAEWEYVARASETNPDGTSEESHTQRILEWYVKPNPPFAAWTQGNFRNVHGIYDMHGLVWEWVENFNTSLTTGESRGDTGLERDLFCGSASVGAADFRDYASFMRYGFRSSLQAKYSVGNLGFRCAADAPTPTQTRP